MKCVAKSGLFFDTCDYDMTENENFEMHYLSQEKVYMGVQFHTIFLSKYAKEKRVSYFYSLATYCATILKSDIEVGWEHQGDWFIHSEFTESRRCSRPSEHL